MRIRAVIFNLFGTLVPYSPAAHAAVVAEMARVLTAPAFEFSQAWAEVMRERETSMEGTLEDDVRFVLRGLGAFTHLEQVQAAVDLLYQFERGLLEAGPDAVETLIRLRGMGLRTGVVANTVTLLARLWPQSVLAPLIDAAVFSCEAGVRKPTARMYEMAAQRLDVEPAACLFVGDGTSYELEGAQAAGMRPVLIEREDESAVDAAASSRERWQGSGTIAKITRLQEVIELAAAGQED